MSFDLISWIRTSGIADVASVVSLPVSVLGLCATIVAVLKARSAAVAAGQARDAIRMFETVVDFSAAITALEEIKRLHRQNDAWPILLDRYGTIRKLLIQLRATPTLLDDEQAAKVQGALVNLRGIEKQVEKGIKDPTALTPVKFNLSISDDIDGLLEVLTQLKSRQVGDP